MYVQQVEANRVKRNQKTMEKHGDPATVGLDSTAASNNWGKFTWLSQLTCLYSGKDSNREGRSRFVLSGKNIQQAGDAPSPLPLYSQPLQAQQGAKFFKGTKSLSPSKISNNSILEQVNVILFHELLSQPITARACCRFWGLITVDILWYS